MPCSWSRAPGATAPPLASSRSWSLVRPDDEPATLSRLPARGYQTVCSCSPHEPPTFSAVRTSTTWARPSVRLSHLSHPSEDAVPDISSEVYSVPAPRSFVVPFNTSGRDSSLIVNLSTCSVSSLSFLKWWGCERCKRGWRGAFAPFAPSVHRVLEMITSLFSGSDGSVSG